MRKGRLKRWVLPTIYVMIIVVSFFSVSIINNLLLGDISNYDYSNSLIKDVTEAVMKENESVNLKETTIIKPYVSLSVKDIVLYYNKDDEPERQQKSLIFYQNTYMPSTGVVYASEEDFDVVAVLDGEVKNVKNDDILGTVIEVSHNTNLTTYYYSLKDVMLNVGDQIKSGTVLGKATTNKIYDKQNNFLFEVYYQGKSLNPDHFYTMNIDELQ
ncbi:MAG: M23 family metallopeptidase [Firmicutes bacterium]|nr:M23 family metallopeptidase [Bacillota bacterium]